jgi:hypothetical protein
MSNIFKSNSRFSALMGETSSKKDVKKEKNKPKPSEVKIQKDKKEEDKKEDKFNSFNSFKSERVRDTYFIYNEKDKQKERKRIEIEEAYRKQKEQEEKEKLLQEEYDFLVKVGELKKIIKESGDDSSQVNANDHYMSVMTPILNMSCPRLYDFLLRHDQIFFQFIHCFEWFQ